MLQPRRIGDRIRREICAWCELDRSRMAYKNVTACTPASLSFSSDVQTVARAKRAHRLRERRKEKQAVDPTSSSADRSPVLLNLQPQDFRDIFDETIPKFRMSQTDLFLAECNRLYLNSSRSVRSLASELGEDGPKLNGSSCNGSHHLQPSNLHSTLVNLSKKRCPLQSHILAGLLSTKKEACYFPKSTISDAKMDDMEDVLISAKNKAHEQGVGWNKSLSTDKATSSSENKSNRAAARELLTHLGRSLPQQKAKSICTFFTNYAENQTHKNLKALSKPLQTRAASHYHLVAEKVAHYFDCHDADTAIGDDKFSSCQEKWEATRAEFVQCMLNLQALLQEEFANGPVVATPRPKAVAAATEQIKPPKKTSAKKQEKAAAHLRFELIPQPDSGPRLEDPNLSRMVFLDNLPIDITEERLETLYSRCGAVNSVQIFQRRPELNPGPLSPAIFAKKRKQQVNKNYQKANFVRTKSPVYGLVDFADSEGFRRATDESLRLFGMIIDYHDVRSIPATEVKTLFLEDFSAKIRCKELERTYGPLLHDDWIICLQPGQSRLAKLQSAEFVFPSFTDAYRAYQTLLAASSNKAKIQWMRTQADAEDWWTRKRVA